MNCNGSEFLSGALVVVAIVVALHVIHWTMKKWELIDAVERDLNRTQGDLKNYYSDLNRCKDEFRRADTRMDILYNQFYELKKQLTEDKNKNENSIS